MTATARATALGAIVTAIGVAAVPARTVGGRGWYDALAGDAGRYIAMARGAAQPYPWGGRWAVPAIARLLPFDPTTALVAINLLGVFAAAALISWLALQHTARTGVLAAAWVFTATGAALPLLFQNPYLTDTVALAVIAGIGVAYLRGHPWTVAALIPAGVAVKEVIAGFVLLLLIERRWTPAAASALASAGMLLLGLHLADPGAATPITLSPTLLVKFGFGLGAAAVIALAAAWAAARATSLSDLWHRPVVRYTAVVVALTVLSLPVATDTTRLLVFALPALVPATAWLLNRVRTGHLAVAALCAAPACFLVIPTRLTLPWLAPVPFDELEQWYVGAVVPIAAAELLACAAAIAVACAGDAASTTRTPADVASR